MYKALFSAAVLLEFIFVPRFLKAMWPEKNKKSLRLKMICSGLFVLMSLCAVQIGGGLTHYGMLMIAGALFGFLGDYFLHAKGTFPYFITGAASFMIGHIMYSAAFSVILLRDFIDYSFFGSAEILLYVIIILAALLLAKQQKIKIAPKALFVATLAYVAVITFMLVKATTLGLYCFAYRFENRVFILISLIAGAVCFVISDMILVSILFGGRKGNYPLKIFNIVTYYMAQMLLASSLLFLA